MDDRSPRAVIRRRLELDLGSAPEMLIKSAVLCAEMGCAAMEPYILGHPDLRCPYGGQANGKEKCRQLRDEYARACEREPRIV